MRPIQIVNLMLEADSPAIDGTGVYMFGPRLDKAGSYSDDFEQAVKRLRELNIIPEGTPDSANLLDRLVNQGYVFIFKHGPGNIEVVGRQLPVQTTTEGADRAIQTLGLNTHVAVAYRKHMADSPKRLQVDQVLYGSKDLDNQQSQAAEPKAKPVAQDMKPIDAPFTIGITFDMRSTNGIKVVEVHPGGPSAQAGIQAGDIIGGTGEFYSKDGSKVGPYRIDRVNDLENTLHIAGGKSAIPFRVIHGSSERFIPVVPQVRQQAANAPGQSLRHEPTDVQKITYQPNERDPSRVTGHLPANVSSVT